MPQEPIKKSLNDKKKKNPNMNISLSRFQRIPLREKIVFTKNLQVMLKTGLSLSNALSTISEQSDNKKFKKILTEIKIKIEQGTTLAGALKAYPKEFNELFVSMIESGELSGNLEEVLDYLQLQMKKDHKLIAKIRGAMIYPSIVVIAMAGIGIIMMVFVIPRLIGIFQEFNTQLPLPTRILIATSNFLTSQGSWVLIGAIVIVIILKAIHRTPQGKRLFHLLILRGPIIGKISRKINLARFSRTLSSLIKTDIPIVKSFGITAKTLSNVHYKLALTTAAEEIKKGITISKSLDNFQKLFPPMVAQMITVGEESGEIDSVLMELANFYEEDIDQTMENLPQIIEPVLILMLGVGVGAMAVAIIMPMYSLTQTI